MLRVEALGKRFGEVVAVRDLDLELQPGELLSLLGPSGCGKTTTLRMVAGFETPSAGRIVVAGRDVTALPPQRRGIGMVFQNYALFPHLSVRENVAFGLESTRVPRAEISGRVDGALRRVDLAGYGERRVQQLSGGQQQRVALARALAPEPPLLLLDEPLSNLDAALRERTRTELRVLLKETGITSVFVTHDQDEAFALSDRIALMNAGRLEQLGTPEALYHAPASAFVAGFVGRANFVDARLLELSGGRGVCELPGGVHWPVRVVGVGAPGAVRVMVRPEALRLAERGAALDGGAPARVEERRFSGAHTLVRLRLADGQALVAAVTGQGGVPADDALVAPAAGEGAHAFAPAAAAA